MSKIYTRHIVYATGHGWQMVVGLVHVDVDSAGASTSSCQTAESITPTGGDIVVTECCTPDWAAHLPANVYPARGWGYNYIELAGKEKESK